VYEVELTYTGVLVSEVLPDDTTSTVSPYRVEGVLDLAGVLPYFEPIVTGAEAISTTVIELTTHAELTPDRSYKLWAGSVHDLYENELDVTSQTFTTEALSVPQARLDENFNYPELIPWGNRRPEEDASRDLEKFLNCLDEVLQLILYDIDVFSDVIDIDLISTNNLDALLAHLGAPFTFIDAMEEVDKRRLAAVLVDAYKRKGVEVGMEAMLNYVLEINCNVRPLYDIDGLWQLGVGALGSTAILGPGVDFLLYSFEVEILTPIAGLTEEKRFWLIEMVEWMKPAHTHFVRLIEPGGVTPEPQP
jgi:phage tail-like protein